MVPCAAELAFRANAAALFCFLGFIVQGYAALCAMRKEAAAAKGVPSLVIAWAIHRARLLQLEGEAFGTGGQKRPTCGSVPGMVFCRRY